MPTNVHFDNLGAIGVIQDIKAHELPPEAWSGSNNVKYTNGYVEKIRGHLEVLSGSPLPFYWGIPWPTNTVYYWLLTGYAKIYRYASGAYYDITRVSGDYNASSGHLWNGVIFGGVPVITHTGLTDYPQQWDSGTGKMVDLTNWPANTYCDFISAHKNFLIAAGILESGIYYPHVVRWSHPAPAGTVPSSWDILDDTTQAGEISLSDTGGLIKGQASLRDLHVVYKEDSIYGMQFIGGQSVFRRWTISKEYGLLATRAIAPFFNQHLFVTYGDVLVHNGQQLESIIDKRNRNWLFREIDSTYFDRTICVHNAKEGEVWICYVEHGKGPWPEQALVWNYTDNTWYPRDLSPCTYLGSGIIDEDPSNVIDDDTGIIDLDHSIIDERLYTPAAEKLLLFDTETNPGTTTFYVEGEAEDFNGTTFVAYAERAGLTFMRQGRDGQPKVDPGVRKLIKRIYPRVEGTGSVQIYIGGQETSSSSIDWTGPFTFDPSVDKYIDLILNTVYLAFRIESSEAITWKLYGYSAEGEIIGGNVV